MQDSAARKVLVTLRSDGETKVGGDVNLLRTFADELGMKHSVDTVYGVPSVATLKHYDVVLTTNLDRPIEPAATLANAKLGGTRCVHYSLHHPYAGIAAYLRHGVHGARKPLATLARYSPSRYEQLLWSAHAANSVLRARRRPAMGRIEEAQRRLVTEADRLVVSSPAEATTIASDIAAPVDYDVVAHPSDFPRGARAPIPGRIIVPGRIESRKNQLLAIRLARRFPNHEFLFVGAPLRSDRQYLQRFERAIDEAENCRHVDHLDKGEFYELLLTAEVVLSASWFEVTSLIELFCAENGIPLAVSHHSYLDAGGATYRFDPTDPADAERALADCLACAAGGGSSTLPSQAEHRTILDVIDGLP